MAWGREQQKLALALRGGLEWKNALAVELETASDLVDPTRDLFVQDERDDNLLDLCVRDAELLRAAGTGRSHELWHSKGGQGSLKRDSPGQGKRSRAACTA